MKTNDIRVQIDGIYYTTVRSATDEQLKLWFITRWQLWMENQISRNLKKGMSLSEAGDAAAKAFRPDDLNSAPQDEIEEEALRLACDDIEAKLAQDGLPAPRSLRDHALQAIQSNDKYYERARLRLQARAEVIKETLNLGV